MRTRRALAAVVGLLFPGVPLVMGMAMWRPGCSTGDLAFVAVIYGLVLGFVVGRYIEQS